jgi:hypothetical protein
MLAEADARRDGYIRLLDQELGELQTAQLGEALRDPAPRANIEAEGSGTTQPCGQSSRPSLAALAYTERIS